MFCGSCGTANADGTTTCRVCGESLIQKHSTSGLRQWAAKNARWLWIPVMGLLAATGIGVYYYRASQEFEITGELLYKNARRVNPVRGARVSVYEDKEKSFLLLRGLPSKYKLLRDRQFYLQLGPATYDPKHDFELAPLGLAALSRMNWTWWEVERLHNCSWAEAKFAEALQVPRLLANTSTDMSGHFWLKLRRGRYLVTAESEVPSFMRIENDPVNSDDTSQPADGNAFWNVPITVTGTMRLVLADPDCDPNL